MAKKHNGDYDVGKAFQAIEDEIIASMMRNMRDHRGREDAEGFNWEQWQAKQLDSLERSKRKNRKKYGGTFSDINSSIDEAIRKAYVEGGMEQEIEILEQIKKRYGNTLTGRAGRLKRNIESKLPFGKANKDFFKVNDERLDALIHATTSDMEKAEHAMLRMADDQYRKIIFNAQAYAISGAGTYKQAVDMATKDFLSAGLNCIEYKNGRRVNIKSYAEMCVRTAEKRAELYADGQVRKKLGITTVIVKKRGNACPKCLPFVGKVLIDDVYSGGTSKDGPYPLLSGAMAAGLFHPNCKDHLSTYIEGITDPPDDTFTKGELDQIQTDSQQEARQQYADNQVDKFERLEKYSLDPENQKQYRCKSEAWKKVANGSEPDTMNLTNSETRALQQYKSFESYLINEALRNAEDFNDLSEVQQKLVRGLDSALSKMPTYQGNLLRTVDFSDWPGSDKMTEGFLKAYIPGKRIKIKQYWSAAKKSGYNENAAIKIYIQDSRKGRDISAIGLDENEVLYERNSTFDVVSRVFQDGIWHILVKEA